jgi:thiol-disulfide isomerase/thioredoxin
VEDQAEFEGLVASHPQVVVDWTAPAWCRPCQQFAPHFERAGTESDAIFIAVDVDKAPWAMVEYGIQGVPTVMLFKGGQYNKNIVGRTALQVLNELKG